MVLRLSRDDAGALGLIMAKVFNMCSSVQYVSTGIKLFMCLYGFAAFIDSPPEIRKPRWPYIIISFLLAVFGIVIAAMEGLHVYNMTFDANSGETFLQVQKQRTAGETDHVVMLAFQAASGIVGEGLLMFRCYVIYNDKWWVCIFPALVYLASAGLGISFAVSTRVTMNEHISASWMITSVVFNVLVTGLIAFRLIRASRHLQQALPGRNLHALNTATTLLVESALPLTLFGLGSVIMYIIPQVSTVVGLPRVGAVITIDSVFSFLYFDFVILSPMIIIFRVTTGKSWAYSTPESSQASPFSKPIAFAHSAHGVSEQDTTFPEHDFGSAANPAMSGGGSEKEMKRAYDAT